MSAKVHRYFIRTARGVAPPLHAAIVQVGTLRLPPRGKHKLAVFLARAIVGQQLSTSAARSIWARLEAAARERGAVMPDFFRARNVRILRRCGLSRAKAKA